MKNTFRNVCPVCDFSIVLWMLISVQIYTLLCTHVLRVSLCPFLKELRREEPGSFPGQRGKRLWRKHAAEEAGELQGNSSWPPSSPSPLFCLGLESLLFSGSHVKCDIFFTVHEMGGQARPAGTESGVGSLFLVSFFSWQCKIQYKTCW